MRTINKYLNIINIILCIIMLEYFFIDIILQYNMYSELFTIFCYTIGSLNIVCGIFDFLKKQKVLGLFFICIGMLEIILGLLYTYANSIVVVFIDIIVFILAILNLMKVIQIHKSKSNYLLIVISSFFIFTEIIIAFLPIILHNISNDNLKSSAKHENTIIEENKTNNIIETNEIENDLKNVFEKYDEKNKFFEDSNQNAKYFYFKNLELTKYTLQVIIKDELETDTYFYNIYEKYNERNNNHRDKEAIKNFYSNKREYYLIDFDNNNKIKLECNNLIYEAVLNASNNLDERIILFSNGNIPFYDETQNGYFNLKDGSKADIDKEHLICDVNNEKITVLEKDTNKTYFLSYQTGQVLEIKDSLIYDKTCIYTQFGILDD